MKELFATLPDEPAPPLPPDYVDSLLARGRRSVRRRRIGTAAAWAAVVLALAVIAFPVVQPRLQPAARLDTPSLPDRFAGYSVLTSTVGKAPAGRAIALYTYGNGELFNMFQPLVVGADRDTYRQVDAMNGRELPSALLAPDGSHVLVGDDRGATSDLILVDLSTGKRRLIPLGGPLGVRLLAWSPDGRFVAYGAAPVTNSPDAVNAVDDEVARTGTLRLLDVATGRSTEIASIKPAWTAAFAPDNSRLAVQVGQTVHLIDLTGRESGSVALPSGRELAANVGWSPDGRFLATVPQETKHDVFLSLANRVGFVALDGGSTPAPVDGVVQVLGWRSVDLMIVVTVDEQGRLSLAEVRLDTRTRRTLSRFDTGSTCEYGTQSCQVTDLQLATGLLADVAVRRAGRPDRGPWPAALTIPTGAVVLGAGLLLWRRMRRP